MKIQIKCEDVPARVEVRRIDYHPDNATAKSKTKEIITPVYFHEILAIRLGISPGEISYHDIRR